MMRTDKKEILRELLLSENRGFVIAIKLKGAMEPIKTAVKSVEHNKIILQPTCIYGHPLNRTTVTLLEIEWVRRYSAFFSSPVLEAIRIVKSNLDKTDLRLVC